MKFLFGQPYAFERLLAVRVSLCFLVMLLLLLGPYDSFYVDTAPWLYSGPLPNLGSHFCTLKGSVLLLAGLFALGRFEKLTGPLFALFFLLFNYYITCFHTTYWITNTHLNFFAIALAISPFLDKSSQKAKELASFLLAFMILYVATLYLQAGVSKCIWGRLEWFTTGNRVWTETLLLGTNFGKWLTQWPILFQAMGIATAFIELVVPFLFFFSRTAKAASLMAISFHLGTFLVMGISFWFLWALFPALFFHLRVFDRFSKGASLVKFYL